MFKWFDGAQFPQLKTFCEKACLYLWKGEREYITKFVGKKCDFRQCEQELRPISHSLLDFSSKGKQSALLHAQNRRSHFHACNTQKAFPHFT